MKARPNNKKIRLGKLSNKKVKQLERTCVIFEFFYNVIWNFPQF